MKEEENGLLKAAMRAVIKNKTNKRQHAALVMLGRLETK